MYPRIVFMGSPEFAIPSLRRIAENYNVIGVVTQPDRPSGRGLSLTFSPVKLLAQELDKPIIQLSTLRQPEVVGRLLSWKPDLIVVVAFGQILPPEVLELPSLGCINVHASLLPRWRGAAPIQAAILNGDEQTGVTIMLMDAGMDTGPILNQRSVQILTMDTAASLGERLSILGAELLVETLPGYLDNAIEPLAQDDSQATYAPKLRKEDGELDFHQPGISLVNRIRAFNPWPGAYTTWKNQTLKIHQATIVLSNEIEDVLSPGQHAIVHEPGTSQAMPAICTARGLLVLNELQPAGKKTMSGKAFLQGARDWV
jgi:methionyl-tRNA formyltransferase